MIKRFVIVAGVLALAACDISPNSDKIANKKQEEMARQAVEQVGLPEIVNFQEKRMAKQIWELRDKAITTFTYLVDLNGRLHLICNSVGYALPYSTQYTNPSKVESYSNGPAVIPQADPNGLFSPGDTHSSFVMCQNPENPKEVMPVQFEPDMIVSPFRLKAVD